MSRALRIAVSTLGGGAFYFVWMSLFLVTAGLGSQALEIVLWLLAPLITAAGFSVGLLIFGMVTHIENLGFRHAFLWAFVGCALGALATYPFGPMLIVFGMLVLGTLSVTLREVLAAKRQQGNHRAGPRGSRFSLRRRRAR